MIRITKQADYGTLLLTLFAREGMGALMTARDLAGKSLLPLPMVSKILKVLAREEILDSQRGLKGGYRLARSPTEINIEEIVDALEGPVALTLCGESAASCDHQTRCPVRPGWQKIGEIVRKTLADITLEEFARSEFGELEVVA